MKPKGLLEIASDHKEYIDHILSVFEETRIFKNAYPSPGYKNKLTNRPITKYETEFRLEGRDIYYLGYRNLKPMSLNKETM